MIITNEMIKNDLVVYSNKNNKISRKIKRGLYETNAKVPGFLLASSICGPSYLSFDFALSYYGLIPEKALCDKMFILPPQKNISAIEALLRNDLRIDFDELMKLSVKDLKEMLFKKWGEIDYKNAKEDVIPFIKDTHSLVTGIFSKI